MFGYFLRWPAAFVLFLCVAAFSEGGEGSKSGVVAVGVLAKNGHAVAEQRWQATVDYLGEQIPDRQFTLTPLGFDEIEAAVSAGAVDFLLANPGIYVEMSHRHGVGRIVTFRNSAGGRSQTHFGGVVFRRAGREGELDLKWLAGKRLAAVAENSLGGWIVAWREMLDDGVDPRRDLAKLSYMGTHEAVVEAVLRGDADAGVVRTNTLERMAAAGGLNLDEVEILLARCVRDGSDAVPAAFPFLLSTRLYPEWPMAKLAHVPDRLAERVAVALLAMSEEHPAAVSAQGCGWTIPGNYRSVDDLLHVLGLGPYANGADIGLGTVIRRYWFHVGAVLLLVLLLVGGLVRMARLNRRLVASESRLRSLATHDGLTGLPNRELFAEVAEKAVANASRHGTLLSILYLDLDRFKPVNDRFGHAIGDLILQDVAERLGRAIRKGDLAARMGGDEFVILLDCVRGREGVGKVMSRIVHAIAETYYVHGIEVRIGCSVGAAMFPRDAEDLPELLQRADLALARAKAEGKGCARMFDELPAAPES